jgi:hypothetical protein
MGGLVARLRLSATGATSSLEGFAAGVSDSFEAFDVFVVGACDSVEGLPLGVARVRSSLEGFAVGVVGVSGAAEGLRLGVAGVKSSLGGLPLRVAGAGELREGSFGVGTAAARSTGALERFVGAGLTAAGVGFASCTGFGASSGAATDRAGTIDATACADFVALLGATELGRAPSVSLCAGSCARSGSRASRDITSCATQR